MPDGEKKWYEHDRVQGAGLILVGILMACFPPTAPHAGVVITAGVGWGSAGIKNALVKMIKK